MKKHNKYIFVEDTIKTVVDASVSDGFIVGRKGDKIKLPHKNYTLLGIVDECINAPYAEDFSADIVDKDEFGGYLDYELEEHNYDSASGSFQTLARVLDLKPTDYILRDDTE